MDSGQSPENTVFRPRNIYHPEHGTGWRDINHAQNYGRHRLPNPIHDLIPTESRRRILLVTGALVTIGGLALATFLTSPHISVAQAKTQIKSAKNTVTTILHPRPDTSQIIIPIEQSKTRNDFTNFFLSTTYSSDGKNVIRLTPAVVNAEIEYTQKQTDHEKDTFLAAKGEALLRYANTQRWNPQIDEAVNNPKIGLKEEEKEFMKKILRLLIAAESGGEKEASSSDNAYGLCQLKDQAIQQAAKYLGLEKYDPKKPDTNILLALAYLQILQRSQPSWAHRLTEYNAGPGIMIGTQRAYLNEKRETDKINPDTLEKEYNTLGINGIDHPATWVLSIFYNATLSQLRESPSVQTYLTKHNIDKEEFGQLFYRMNALAQAWGYTN